MPFQTELTWPAVISLPAVTAALTALDATAGLELRSNHTAIATKSTAWTPAHITAAQAVVTSTALTNNVTSHWTNAVSHAALNAAFQAVDPTALVVLASNGLVTLTKSTTWTVAQLTAARTALDTTVELTARAIAQRNINAWPIETKALALLLVDQINILRAFHALPAITTQQAIDAVVAKAGTL